MLNFKPTVQNPPSEPFTHGEAIVKERLVKATLDVESDHVMDAPKLAQQ